MIRVATRLSTAICFLSLALATSAERAAGYTLIHGFAGPPSDGAGPEYGSLATDGTVLYGMTLNGGATNSGTLFKVNTDGTGFQLLHSFTGLSFEDIVLNDAANTNDGLNPYGTPLLIGSTLYGMTIMGGTNGLGTVFKINTDGSGFQLLHSFGSYSPPDGQSPYGSLVTDGTNLFGMTSSGSSYDGTIFMIGTDGTGYRILHDFQADQIDGLSPWGSLVLANGVLYGMTLFGGIANNGTIFQINTDGTGYQKIHDFGGINNGASPYGSLIVSGSTLYGMSSGGGTNGVGAVFSIETSGTNFQILHSFSLYELNKPFGDLTLSNSTLYGMAALGGTNGLGLGGVFQVNTDGSGYQFVHIFSFGPLDTQDGSQPTGTLLLSGSQLYGMTYFGGSGANYGAVFSLAGANGGGGGGGVGSLKVTILPAAVVTAGAQWEVDGGNVFDSGITIANLSAGQHTVYFSDVSGWATAPTQLITITADTTTSITGTYTQLKVTKPTVTIVTPTKGLHVSNSVFTATGTSSDTVRISGVYYQLNGGPWTLATTVNHWTNWSATNLNLTAGMNTFSAYAMDKNNDLSATNSVIFDFVVSAQLTVNTNGAGTIKPNLNGAEEPIGKILSMDAKAAKGFAFIGWSGSFSTNNAKLTFVMASNLEFTANFKDIARPVLVVLSPTKKQVVTNAAPIATGRAKDNVGVTAVQYRVNGGDWIPAILSDGTNWTTTNLAPFLLSGTNNSISAFASDAAGNNSLTNTVPFKYVTP